MTKIGEWIKRRLGIDKVEQRVSRLEQMDYFTLQDVVNRLGDAYIVMPYNDQKCINNDIRIPPNKKGVLMLGERGTVADCTLRPAKTKTTTTVTVLE